MPHRLVALALLATKYTLGHDFELQISLPVSSRNWLTSKLEAAGFSRQVRSTPGMRWEHLGWSLYRSSSCGLPTCASHDLQVAIWAATNLAPLPSSGDGGLGWGFDLSGIAQMFRCDASLLLG